MYCGPMHMWRKARGPMLALYGFARGGQKTERCKCEMQGNNGVRRTSKEEVFIFDYALGLS
jgi:hypothetical protein